jgi:hypothetical protein
MEIVFGPRERPHIGCKVIFLRIYSQNKIEQRHTYAGPRFI